MNYGAHPIKCLVKINFILINLFKYLFWSSGVVFVVVGSIYLSGKIITLTNSSPLKTVLIIYITIGVIVVVVGTLRCSVNVGNARILDSVKFKTTFIAELKCIIFIGIIITARVVFGIFALVRWQSNLACFGSNNYTNWQLTNGNSLEQNFPILSCYPLNIKCNISNNGTIFSKECVFKLRDDVDKCFRILIGLSFGTSAFEMSLLVFIYSITKTIGYRSLMLGKYRFTNVAQHL